MLSIGRCSSTHTRSSSLRSLASVHRLFVLSKAISQAKMLLLLLAVITIVSTAPVSKWIDLSYTVDENVMRYPLHRPFNHTPAIYIKDKAFFAKSFDISTAEHVATHIDAPNHLTNTEEEARNFKSIDQIPLDGLIGDAIVVNISAKAAINPDAELTVEDLQEWEKQYGQIPDGAILLMNSGWGKYWGNKEKFTGTKTENSSLLHYPGMHKDAAQWLVDNRNIKVFGTDTLSLDYGPSSDFPTHVALLPRGIIGIEMVANVEKLPPKGATVFVLPMKIGGGTGAPVRMIATIKEPMPINRLPRLAGYLALIAMANMLALLF
ncbi:isatin hydrolase-like [Nematostella vectensis]|uniref:isatin hydrolase-like n=1 Tax=Nematostella vectensis TaxID=45351 RepID=UPI002076F593|nr:isatin hydrolase-like [Nematostella vectensis]